MTHTGKIGRLPWLIREELNRRLQDGHPGTHLVQWLNSLPEVQDILVRYFSGHKIKPRNLRAWKVFGHREWQFRNRYIEAAAVPKNARRCESGPPVKSAELNQDAQIRLELMNQWRPGKIAHLPRELRNELNRRLRNGEKGSHLIDRLNRLPAVQSILARDFGGRPINAVNLTQWKKRGYRDWLLQCEIAEKRLEVCKALQTETQANGRVN